MKLKVIVCLDWIKCWNGRKILNCFFLLEKKLNLQKQNKIEDNVIFIQYILTWHFSNSEMETFINLLRGWVYQWRIKSFIISTSLQLIELLQMKKMCVNRYYMEW